MLYIYALLGSEPREIPVGVRIVPSGFLFAAVSETSSPPPVQESSLRNHEKIVRELASGVGAILPARFGSVIADEQALVRRLESRENEWRSALDLVDGREQMTLRVSGEMPTPPQLDDSLGPGRRYLARKKRGLDALRSALTPFVAPLVKAERIQLHDSPPLVASIYHLIERGQSAAYVTALEQMDPGSSPFRFVVSGPWPPYAFGRWEES